MPCTVDVALRSVCPYRLAVEEANVARSGRQLQAELCPVQVFAFGLVDICFEQSCALAQQVFVYIELFLFLFVQEQDLDDLVGETDEVPSVLAKAIVP